MARSPLSQRSKVVTIPAPYNGWNARDALTAMKPSEAVRLENFVPDAGGIKLRKGYSSHSTGVGTRVDSLMAYTPPGTGAKLFAASSGGTLYDVTATSTATNTATATFSNGQFQHTMFGTPAGSFLMICNGADVPFMWDGTGPWATASITGCTAGSSTFIGVAAHQSRLWFIQKNTLDVWYLPTSSVQGAATRLQLGPFCRKGGYLQAIASWTRDGGSGMDDQVAFITSKGEAILYSGSDPSDATLFAKVGTFNIPEPIGYRCVTQIGGDVALITSQGVVPLSSILPLSPGGAAKVAATERISNAFQEAYALSSTAFGWQTIENSRERLLIVNVPRVEGTTIEQYVMSTMSLGWCKFTGIDANCWATFGDKLFFGGVNGTVYRYGSQTTDAGDAITGISTSAFTDFGVPAIKQVQMVRATARAPEGMVPGVGVHTDYNTDSISVVGQSYTASGTDWDTAQWDSFAWAGGLALTHDWQSVNGMGTTFAVETQVTSSDQISLNAMDVMFETGGYL